MHQPGTRKREWRDAEEPRGGRTDGQGIEHEMKRLRLAKDERANEAKRWSEDGAGDVDMDADMGDASPRVDYRPINLTLRECHYLRQLRKFQAERVSYLERRAPSDAAAAAVVHAMQPRRR